MMRCVEGLVTDVDFDTCDICRERYIDRRRRDNDRVSGFPSEAKCQAAADDLAGADQINFSRGNRPNISPSAIYRIVAHCVER
jgi:hypothetical protein